jgi:hypothetical protein
MTGPASLAAAIALTDRHGGTITARQGKVHVKVLPGTPDQAWLRDVLSANRDLLLAVAIGRQPVKLGREAFTHQLLPCTECGEPSMVAVTLTGKRPGHAVWPRCRMTHGCRGRHEPRP